MSRKVNVWIFPVIIWGACLGIAALAQAQDSAPSTSPQTTSAPPTTASPDYSQSKSFNELLVEWKKIDSDLVAKEKEFNDTPDTEITKRSDLREQYKDLVKNGNQIIEQLRLAAINKINADGGDPLVIKTLLGIMVNDARNQLDGVVLQTADTLIAKKIDSRYWEIASKMDLKIEAREVFEEVLLRAKEAEANSLPRAIISTNRGNIEVELFEDQAPNTVANFISLAKSGFYNGLKFHRVIESFMAQTGSPKGDGSDGPGYTIADECKSPEARRHFSSVLSMAKSPLPDSGGSQFFITFSRTSELDGRHTVFGRVLSGFEVLDKITRTHQLTMNATGQSDEVPIPAAEADTITKIEIVRDRGHEYKPVKMGDAQPAETKPDETKPAETKPATDGGETKTDPPMTDEKKEAEPKKEGATDNPGDASQADEKKDPEKKDPEKKDGEQSGEQPPETKKEADPPKQDGEPQKEGEPKKDGEPK